MLFHLITSAACLAIVFFTKVLCEDEIFPNSAALTDRTTHRIQCGVVLISPSHALSPAYCAQGIEPKNVQFSIGKKNIFNKTDESIQRLEVSKIVVHPDFDVDTSVNDIALIVLQSPVNLTEGFAPTCVPKEAMDISGQNVSVVGWRFSYISTQYDQFNRTVMELSKCASDYGLNTTNPTQICTEAFTEKSPECENASKWTFWPVSLVSRAASPAGNATTDSLVGIVSYGLDCSLTTPGVSTDVLAYVDWIESTIKESGVSGDLCRN